MSACRLCSAPLRWARTSNGKPMPLDPEPNDAGNVTLDERGTATVHGQGAAVDGVRYMAHFVTCPDWQRRRRNA